MIPRETFDERPLSTAVAALAERVADFFRRGGGGGGGDEDANDAYYTATVTPTGRQFLFDSGQQCIDTGWNCGGDNRDTNYVRCATFRLPDENTVVYVVGVNHAATGNAHYSNLAVYNAARNLGVVAVDDSEYAGTARRWAEGRGGAPRPSISLHHTHIKPHHTTLHHDSQFSQALTFRFM